MCLGRCRELFHQKFFRTMRMCNQIVAHRLLPQSRSMRWGQKARLLSFAAVLLIAALALFARSAFRPDVEVQFLGDTNVLDVPLALFSVAYRGQTRQHA